jgi:hypothetical protein
MAFPFLRLREYEKTHLLLARCVSVLIHQLGYLGYEITSRR